MNELRTYYIAIWGSFRSDIEIESWRMEYTIKDLVEKVEDNNLMSTFDSIHQVMVF